MSRVTERHAVVRYSAEDILDRLMEEGAGGVAPSMLSVRIERWGENEALEATDVRSVEFIAIEDGRVRERIDELRPRLRRAMRRLRRRLSKDDFRLVLVLEELLNERAAVERAACARQAPKSGSVRKPA